MDKSQLEPSAKIRELIADIKKPITPDKLKQIKERLDLKIELRPYNESTREHEKAIRWRRTASQILQDGFVYEGKACTDQVVLFLAFCQALELETRFVKIKKGEMVHSVAEIKLSDGWYVFDVSGKSTAPIKGEITDETPYKDWQLWRKGRDAWDLGLNSFETIKKIHQNEG